LSGAALAKTWLCGISDCLVGCCWYGCVVLFVSHFKVRDTNTDAVAENALPYALAHAATLRRRASESVRVVEIRPTIRGSGTFVYQFSQTEQLRSSDQKKPTQNQTNKISSLQQQNARPFAPRDRYFGAHPLCQRREKLSPGARSAKRTHRQARGWRGCRQRECRFHFETAGEFSVKTFHVRLRVSERS
jgi:hypothetical protein